MPQVDPAALEAVIKQAGLGERSAKKLREANEPQSEPEPRGHGTPSQSIVTIDDI